MLVWATGLGDLKGNCAVFMCPTVAPSANVLSRDNGAFANSTSSTVLCCQGWPIRVWVALHISQGRLLNAVICSDCLSTLQSFLEQRQQVWRHWLAIKTIKNFFRICEDVRPRSLRLNCASLTMRVQQRPCFATPWRMAFISWLLKAPCFPANRLAGWKQEKLDSELN